MDFKRPRKLNLNAPLLSTRRFGFSGVADTSCSSNSLCNTTAAHNTTSERVPFSWEQAPGKPKEDGGGSCGGTPRLKPPPCLIYPPREEANNEADADNSNNSDDVALCHDQGGDHNNDDDDDDDDFSDAMDVFSLSEALDIVQKKSERAHYCGNKKNNNEGLRLKIEEDSNGYQSPTYMINRFLPDATALAASSALHFHSSNFGNRVCDTCSYAEHSYASSSSISPKSYCGLEILFPWRVKHKLCSIKSPVLPCFTNLQKHSSSNNKRSTKQKKHHMPWSCTNAKDDV